jgi:hypothetical protein
MTGSSGATIVASFSTRRQADLAIEQLVQELAIERTDVFVTAEGDENSSGREIDGADAESGHPGTTAGGSPSLTGSISVSVDLTDNSDFANARSVFEQHGGEDIATE